MSRRINGWLIGGGVIVLALLALAAFPGAFAPHGPDDKFWPVWDAAGRLIPRPLAPGQGGLWLGSDMNGRDLLSRIIWGTRTSLGLALGITAARLLIGLPLGLWGGWSRGWPAALVGMLVNAGTALPVLLVLVLFLKPLQGLTMLGASQTAWMVQFCLLVTLLGVPRLAESIRRRVEVAAEAPHLEGAVAAGSTRWWLLRRHVLPFVWPDVAVLFTAELGWVLLLMGQLGVVGVFLAGGEVDVMSGKSYDALPEWGQMMAVARGLVLTRPWVIMVPGTALALASVGFHVFAEGLRRRWQHIG